MDLTPENTQTRTVTGYRWSCTKEKQIMRQREVFQPESGLSADQSAVGEETGRSGRKEGRRKGWRDRRQKKVKSCKSLCRRCETVMLVEQEKKTSFRWIKFYYP